MTAAQPPDAGEELILRPSRTQAWLRFAVLLLVTAGYSWLASRYSDCLLIWLFALVGVVLTFKGLGRALDRNSCLRLTPRGFAIHDGWSVLAFSWDEIESFTVGNRGRTVLFNYARRDEATSGARKLARFLAGGEGALPSTYGMDATGLAALLSEWHGRYRSPKEEPETSD